MRVLGVLVLLCLLSAAGSLPAVADEPRAAEPPGGMLASRDLEVTLREWLVTGDDLHAAWAGWLVAERRLVGLQDAVADRLARSAETVAARTHAYFTDQALLDALVQTGGTAPGSTLCRLASAHVETVTVLLCRRGAFDPAHLAVFRTVSQGTDFEAYVALGNVMAAWRTPAFVAQILDDLELARLVRIGDEDPPYARFGRPGACVPGDSVRRVPIGYPPVGRHSLSFERYEWGEWTTLCDGVHPVYVRRTVSSGGRLWDSCVDSFPDPREEYRREWLEAYLEGADVPDLPAFATLDVKWTGGRQTWTRRTTRAVEQLHAAFRAWRDALYARGLLTDEDRRTVRPQLELEVVDWRRLKRHPLPPFPDVPFDPRVRERRPPPRRKGV